MNLNEVDWESLEKTWGFLFKNGHFERSYRKGIITHPQGKTEPLVILMSAYEKFEELIQK